jgi:hypothetical protein
MLAQRPVREARNADGGAGIGVDPPVEGFKRTNWGTRALEWKSQWAVFKLIDIEQLPVPGCGHNVSKPGELKEIYDRALQPNWLRANVAAAS